MSRVQSSSTTSTATTTMPSDQPTLHLQQSSADDCDPPPPPVPSTDPRLSLDGQDAAEAEPKPEPSDLFKLPPSEALKLLTASVELLVRLTGDIPPTPPPQTPTDPQMSGMQAEKEQIARSYSDKSLARLRQQAEKDMQKAAKKAQAEAGSKSLNVDQSGVSTIQAYSAALAVKLTAQQNKIKSSPHSPFSRDPETIDGVYLRPNATSPTSPPPTQPKPYVIIGADSQPLNLQHGAITRKFYSKNEPPISINQYLLRLHQFCPMSTAVYLATSLYIHRLAVEEQAIPVTRRNAHRLVLAGLRVAMKALEDLSYPHAKIAKVGGVSEVELARLEISFCFLAGFELVVGEEQLNSHLNTLKDSRARQVLSRIEVPALKLEPRLRNRQKACE